MPRAVRDHARRYDPRPSPAPHPDQSPRRTGRAHPLECAGVARRARSLAPRAYGRDARSPHSARRQIKGSAFLTALTCRWYDHRQSQEALRGACAAGRGAGHRCTGRASGRQGGSHEASSNSPGGCGHRRRVADRGRAGGRLRRGQHVAGRHRHRSDTQERRHSHARLPVRAHDTGPGDRLEHHRLADRALCLRKPVPLRGQARGGRHAARAGHRRRHAGDQQRRQDVHHQAQAGRQVPAAGES